MNAVGYRCWLELPVNIWVKVARNLPIRDRLQLLTTCSYLRTTEFIVSVFSDDLAGNLTKMRRVCLQNQKNIAASSILSVLLNAQRALSFSYTKVDGSALRGDKESNIEIVACRHLRLTDSAVTSLHSMTSLRELFFSDVQFATNQIDELSGSVSRLNFLASLTLDRISVTPFGLPFFPLKRGLLPLLASLPHSLRRLTVANSVILEDRVFNESLGKLTALHTLVLKSNFNLKGGHISSIPPSIEVLVEAENDLSRAPMESLTRLTNLQNLYMRTCKISGAVLNHLSPTLQLVDLEANRLRSMQIGSHLTQLKVLNLSRNILVAGTVQALPTQLVGLVLKHCLLENDAVLQASRLTNLRIIDLSNNPITGETLSAIPRSVKAVLLAGCPISAPNVSAACNLSLKGEIDPLQELTKEFGRISISAKDGVNLK